MTSAPHQQQLNSGACGFSSSLAACHTTLLCLLVGGSRDVAQQRGTVTGTAGASVRRHQAEPALVDASCVQPCSFVLKMPNLKLQVYMQASPGARGLRELDDSRATPSQDGEPFQFPGARPEITATPALSTRTMPLQDAEGVPG